MGVSFSVAVFLQTVRGYNAIETGVIFTAATLGVLRLVARRRAPRQAAPAADADHGRLRRHRRPGSGSCSPWSGRRRASVAFAPGLLLIGLGLGVMLTPSVNVVQSSFPEELQGEISGLSRSVSNLGSSFGTAIAGTILVSDLASGNTTYVLAMVVLAVLALVGLAAAVLLPRGPAPRGTSVELTATGALDPATGPG